MSFRIGSSSKPAHTPLPKTKGGISLGGFSFKQLEEEEEEEEDLSICTGKYDKVLEESQKVQMRSRENTLSTSSNSSTSSTSGDVKILDSKVPSDSIGGNKDASKMSKPLPLDPAETATSPLRNVKEKLESSRELFAGLKGKTLHEISKAIDAFSGDSSCSPSPDNEMPKPLPAQSEKSNNVGPVVAESVNLLHSAAPVIEHPLAFNDKDDIDEEEDMEAADIFKDPEEDTISINSAESVDDADALVFQEIYSNEPYEDFTGTQGLSTSTKLKPKSKLKRLINKNSKKKTMACASLSGLASLPEQNIDSQLSDSKTGEKNEETKVLSSKSNAVSNPSDSKPFKLINQLNNTDYSELPLHKFAAISVVVFAYLIFPLPSYLSGFVMGCILTSFGGLLYMWLTRPVKPSEPILLPPIEDLPPPPVPEMKEAKDLDETLYKGWMNELADYKVDDYHINKTHSVFISLEATHLRVQRPKNPAPKRAMWNENITKPQFIHQRHFDMRGSNVYLFPFGLVKKRIWSKKYPICIDFTKTSAANESKEPPPMKHASSEPLLVGREKDKSTDMGFEIISSAEKYGDILYLFARTGREKEDWFKRFSAAANGNPLGNHVLDIKRAMKQHLLTSAQRDLSSRTQREGSVDSLNSLSNQPDIQQATTHLEGADLFSFATYMGRLMPTGPSTPTSQGSSPAHSSNKLPGNQDKEETPKHIHRSGPVICDNQLFWLNALIGRSFFDFLRDKWWIEKVTEKLQRKLSKIRVPYFIEELQVTSIDMGYEIPAIRHAGRPYLDERGFWVDLDLTYSGGFKMTIETKINLMKLKKSSHASTSQGHSVDGSKSAITDSEEEDSAESSTDEEEEVPANTEDSSPSGSGGGTSKKFLRYLNKITQSRYFQQATQYKVIRRAMENVSNTPLTLTVTVNSLIGKLAINIPPPPSDRLWYGFRVNPHLRLSAKPQVGERAVTITHVTEWIEKKLGLEFQRVFVMPNMDDLVIPILVPGTQVKDQAQSQSEDDN